MNSKKLIISVTVIVFALAMIACGGDKPTESTTIAPTESAPVAVDPEITKGEEIFLQNCASCHGENGAGDGAAASALNPKPRNYKAPVGEWKNGNNLAGITKTLNEGIKGGSMAPFKYLGPDNIKILAKYVEHLTKN